MLSSTAFPRIRRAAFIGSGMAVGLQLGACLNNGLGYSRVHKASTIAILLEVVLNPCNTSTQLKERLQKLSAPDGPCGGDWYSLS